MISMIKQSLFLLTLIASVYCLGVPHARSVHKRHALAIRAPAPLPTPEVEALKPWAARRKRATRNRCAAKTASSSPIAATPSTTPSTNAPSSPTDAATPTPSTDGATADAASQTPAADPPVQAAAGDANGSTSSSTSATASPTAATPAPAPSGGSSSAGMSGSGQITYYATGLGACGITNVDTDYIAAVAIPMFDNWAGATANPNNNPICGKQVELTHGGKTITITITDRCAACAYGDFDLSPTAFSALADQAIGRTDVSWKFLD